MPFQHVVFQPTIVTHAIPKPVTDVPWFSERNCEHVVHAPVPLVVTQKIDEPKFFISEQPVGMLAPFASHACCAHRSEHGGCACLSSYVGDRQFCQVYP